MKTLRISGTALLLASLVPLLSAAPQSAAKAKALRLDKKSQTQQAKPDLTPAQEDLARLSKEAMKLRRAEYAKQREEMKKQQAESGGQAISIRMRMPDLSPLVPQYIRCARKYQKTDDAIMFLTQILMISKNKQIQNEALSTLWKYHYESDKLADFAVMVPRLAYSLGKDRCDEIMAKLAKSPNKNVQGAALYSEASAALRNRKIDAKAKEAAHAKLERAVELAPHASFTPKAQGILFEANHLQVGMKAPDIEGRDTDGVAFKLSDYKGKVIMVDFWGDW